MYMYVSVCNYIYIYKYIYMCMSNAYAQECVSMCIPCLGSLCPCTWEQRLALDVFPFFSFFFFEVMCLIDPLFS